MIVKTMRLSVGSNAEINKDFLHENIRGILLAETSGLTSSEFASVLATSGTTSAEGKGIGNNWKFSHLVDAFCTQWSDAALAARDAKVRNFEAVVAAVDNSDLSELSEAAARIENAISWNDTDPQIVECEDDDDDHYAEDVDWYAGDCDDKLDDTAYTAGAPKCMLRQVAVFKKHVSFWLVSRVPDAMFLLLVLVLLMAWLTHPLPKSQNSRVESRPPMSKKRPTEVGATRGGPHHVPRLRPDQCMLCRQVGHRASECPDKAKPTAFSPRKRAFGTYALSCAVFDSQCYGATVEEIEQGQDEKGIEDIVAFLIKSLEGFAILDGGATKTVSGFMIVQPVAVRYEAPRLRRLMLALRSLVAKRRRRTRKSTYHMLSSRKEFRCMLCRMSQLRFSLAWMCYVSTGWLQSHLETLPSLCNSSNGTSGFGNVAEQQ